MIKNRKKLRKIKYFILSFCLIFTLTNFSFASSIIDGDSKPAFEILDRDNGLSNLSISSIIQDKYGYLWFGSQSGLNKYDGRNVIIYRNKPFNNNGLIHNLIQTMYYDKENHEIWIGTYQGISRFSISTQTFKHYTVKENGLSNPIIISIEKDANGQIWAGTMSGLNKINPETHEIVNYDVPGNTVRDIHFDSKGTMYLGTYKGLAYFDMESHQVKIVDIKLPSPYCMVIKEFDSGVLTFGMWDGGTAEYIPSTNSLTTRDYPDNRIYSIERTKDGTLWVGSWGGGLFAVKNNQIIDFAKKIDKPEYSKTVIYSMLEDETGIFWVGTNGNGIIKLNPQKKNYLLFSNQLKGSKKIKSGKINNMLIDSRGNYWIEIYNQGLNRYDPKTDTMHDYINNPDDETSLPDNRISDIIETRSGEILLATSKGVVKYSYETNKFSKLDIFSGEIKIVYEIKEDKDRNLWIGTYSNGIYYYNTKTKEIKEYNYENKKISDNLIYDILIDSKKRVWLATNNGLNLYLPNEDRFKAFHKEEGKRDTLGTNSTRYLLEDSKGNIWIGTNGGGVSRYNENENNFTTFIEEDGLSNNIVNAILEANDGKIWLTTYNGLSILNPETNEFDVLTPDDGVGAWEFNSGAYKMKDGRLLFGGAHGITAIPSSIDDKSLIPPRLYISDVKIYQNSISKNKESFNNEKLVFSPQEDFIEFQFTALDYDTPEKIKFSYKLEGFNDEWIYNGTRDYISFSHLKPGEYKLFVKAVTVKGGESKVEKLSFIIKKPWYLTNFAYFGYSTLSILIILFIIKVRDWILLHRKNSELSKLNQKLEEMNNELLEVSLIDELTGLNNKRYFNEKIEELLELSKRSNTPLALLMVDLDNFKPINDSYGHLAGDYFLEDIGKLIKSSLIRNTDFGTRFGGDEFAVLLYDTDQNGAKKVAEKLKNGISNISIRNEHKVFTNIRTTVSIGLISLIPDSDTSIESIIEKADQALYHAKKNGRDRICTNKDCKVN